MPAEVIRIFSDLHYGDKSSRVDRLAGLTPLTEGATAWVINGDLMDTRVGPRPDLTRECREETAAYLSRLGLPVTTLTGNHDPDISEVHTLNLAQGRVFLTHGDVLYDTIVPWGQDAPLVRRRMAEERAKRGTPWAPTLGEELALVRQIAAEIPQRHQSERNGYRYARRLAADTIWPPWRVPSIFAAWFTYSQRARAFARRHRLPAQYVLNGHTHRAGIWRKRGGPIVVNTGAFCRPFQAWAIDLADERLLIREVEPRSGEFRLGRRVAELPLTPPAG